MKPGDSLSALGVEPPRLQIRNGIVDVWHVHLGGPYSLFEAILDDAERARAARFARLPDRHRWIASRATLRMLAGRYLDADPSELRFNTGAHGKPGIDGHRLRFNLSHAGDLAVYAFAVGTEVGVDLELLGRRIDTLSVARRVFGDHEAQRLAGLGERAREREFLRMWVRHEAELKCRGTGFAGHERGDRAPGIQLWTQDLDVGSCAVGALSVAARSATVRRFSTQPSPQPA